MVSFVCLCLLDTMNYTNVELDREIEREVQTLPALYVSVHLANHYVEGIIVGVNR